MKESRKRKRKQKINHFLLVLAMIELFFIIHIVIELGKLIVKNMQEFHVRETQIQFESEYNKNELYESSEEIPLDFESYPEVLRHAYERNPEIKEFVLNYPSKKGTYSSESLKDCLGKSKVPLLLQWDSRWGYYAYGSSIIGVTGCGPTCLSMVSLHLLQDATLTPIYMANYAKENGYYITDVGTDWSFMTDGAKAFGLKVQEVSLTERIVKRHLEQGRPIICAMRPGDFTETGHFIVLVGVENGKIRVNDPNSKLRSKRLWDYEELEPQIKNMWAYSVR